MPAVLDVTQTGSGSAAISAESGDTLTLELNSTVYNNALGSILAALSGVTAVTGVKFAVNDAGTAGTVLGITQSGSATTSIAAESGDTLTWELAETVYSNILEGALARLKAITDWTGVIFAVNTTGGAT